MCNPGDLICLGSVEELYCTIGRLLVYGGGAIAVVITFVAVILVLGRIIDYISNLWILASYFDRVRREKYMKSVYKTKSEIFRLEFQKEAMNDDFFNLFKGIKVDKK